MGVWVYTKSIDVTLQKRPTVLIRMSPHTCDLSHELGDTI